MGFQKTGKAPVVMVIEKTATTPATCKPHDFHEQVCRRCGAREVQPPPPTK